MVKDTIKHGRSQDRVSHHFSPLRDLLVGREDDRSGLVGIADEGEESVGLSTRDRRISDLIYDHQLCFLQVFQAKSGGSFAIGSVHDPDQIPHFLEADSVSGLDSVQTKAHGDHCLAKTGWPGKDDVATGVKPVELPDLSDLSFGNAAFQFFRDKILQRLWIRREMRCGIVAFPASFISPLYLCLKQFQKELPV